MEVTGLYDIEVDPTNSNNIFFAYADIGLLRSEDGGKTFKRSIGGLDLSTVNTFFKVVFDPDDSSIIYAGRGWWHWDSGELVKSVDGGKNWITLGSPANGLPDARVFDLALDYSSPFESRTIYAVSYGDGVFKSIDGGTSWEAINHGIEIDGEIFGKSIEIDPEDPNTLYVSLDQNGGLYKTTDGGANWQRLPLDYESIWFVEIGPHDPQTIFASVPYLETEGGLYRSLDGGASWELIFVNTFVSGIVFDPTNPLVIYVSTKDTFENTKGDGVFRSMDGGETWSSINEGLSHLSIFSIGIDPNDPSIIFIGSEGNGAFKGVGD